MVIHATPDQDLNEFEELFSLVRKEKETTTAESQSVENESEQDVEIPEETPLPILIIGGKTVASKKNDLTHVVHLPDAIDLRILSFAIDSLIIGNPFSLHGVEQSPENSTEDVPVSTPEKDTFTKEVPFTFKTRIVQNMAVVIELHGAVTVDKFKELINIVITLLNKTPNLGIDFSFTTHVPLEFYLLLENFRKVIQAKNGKVCLFCLESNSTNAPINKKYVSVFKVDSEFIRDLKLNSSVSS